jgi:hypothetical protein
MHKPVAWWAARWDNYRRDFHIVGLLSLGEQRVCTFSLVKSLFEQNYCKADYKPWIVRKWRLRPEKKTKRKVGQNSKHCNLRWADTKAKTLKSVSIGIHRDLFWKVTRTFQNLLSVLLSVYHSGSVYENLKLSSSIVAILQYTLSSPRGSSKQYT